MITSPINTEARRDAEVLRQLLREAFELRPTWGCSEREFFSQRLLSELSGIVSNLEVRGYGLRDGGK